MSVFLLILKIIGITLLAVIGLLLLVILLILFVPVRYCADASYLQKPNVAGKVTWLLHILSFRFSYDENGFTKHFRIFGIDLLNRKKKEKRARKPKKQKKPKKEKPLNRLPEESEYTLEGFDAPDEKEQDVTSFDAPKDENSERESAPEEEKGFFAKLKEFAGKIFDLITHFTDKVKAVFEKIRSVKDNLEKYISVISNERNQQTIKNALAQILKVLYSVRPRKWKGYARFGMEDPATTGQILAILSVLYPWIGPHMKIEPDFEEQIVEGETYIKGRIFVIVLLVAAWKLYFDKDLRKMLKSLKKEA